MNDIEILNQLLSSHKIHLNQPQLTQLINYKKLLLHWTKTTNLISKNTICNFNTIHLLDSLLPLTWLKTKGPLLDLGTGGGLPGITIKILFPEIPITLCESKSRKIKFLQSCISTLNLNRINIFNPTHDKPERKYIMLVSRAFGSLEKIIRESKKYLTPTGEIFAYKGQKETTKKELSLIPAHWNSTLQQYNYQINDQSVNRTIVILKKKGK